MKALCAVLLAFCGLLTGTAGAANWVKVVDSNHSRVFVDTDSISRVGDIVSAWYKRDFAHPIPSEKSGQQYKTSKVLSYYNCADREVAPARWITYAEWDASGKPISNERVSPLEYGDISASEFGEAVFDFVCKYVKTGKK